MNILMHFSAAVTNCWNKKLYYHKNILFRLKINEKKEGREEKNKQINEQTRVTYCIFKFVQLRNKKHLGVVHVIPASRDGTLVEIPFVMQILMRVYNA